MPTYTPLQLDGLRELANIGSGTAAHALSQLLGHPVDINVPTVQVLPVTDAVQEAGDANEMTYGLVVPFSGDMEALVVLVLPEQDAATLCGIFGIDPSGPDGSSMLGEIGNIVGASYINALGQLSGLEMEPDPPQVAHDHLGSILAAVLLAHGDIDEAVLLDSRLTVERKPCSLSFLLLPAPGGVTELLGSIGLA